MSKLVLKTDHSIEMVGTLEVVPGIASLGNDIKQLPDGKFELAYNGTGTKMIWDNQLTLTRQGQRVFVDESGIEYTEDQLELIDESDTPAEMQKRVYKLLIEIEVPVGADPEAAREEIVGSIEDARDSDELGGCDVSWGDLEEITE